jgi:alpha-D-xyloside xylohydrolase
MIVCAMVVAGYAQPYEKTGHGIRATLHSMNIETQFFSPSLVRVLKGPEGTSFTHQSLSVVQAPQSVAVDIRQAGDDLLMTSESLRVTLNLKTGTISYTAPSGRPLFREKESGAEFSDRDDAGVRSHRVRQSFVLDRDEAIYGLGQQQSGTMVQRNQALTMIQGNTDDYVPFFQSAKGYGLFWDNCSPTVFVDDSAGASFTSVSSGLRGLPRGTIRSHRTRWRAQGLPS